MPEAQGQVLKEKKCKIFSRLGNAERLEKHSTHFRRRAMIGFFHAEWGIHGFSESDKLAIHAKSRSRGP